jgi:hypothetical protein
MLREVYRIWRFDSLVRGAKISRCTAITLQWIMVLRCGNRRFVNNFMCKRFASAIAVLRSDCHLKGSFDSEATGASAAAGLAAAAASAAAGVAAVAPAPALADVVVLVTETSFEVYR